MGMITTQEIAETARCFAGRALTEGEDAVLTYLCQAAGDLWRDRLREGIEPEDCRGVFLTASAWTAVSYLAGAMELGQAGVLAFAAGDLSVRLGDGASGACGKSLRTQAEELMAPYTMDEAFAFREVEG